MQKLINWFFGKKLKYHNKYNNPIDKKVRKMGCIIKKDPEDKRDYQYKTFVGVGEVILPDVSPDIEPYLTQIKSQGNLGACAGFAAVAGWEYYKNAKQNKGFDGSELALYWHTREIMGTVNQDSGSYLRDMCKAMKDTGVTLESLWPYNISQFKEKPSWAADFAARYGKINSYYRANSVYEMKAALNNGDPVFFGMSVYDNFLTFKGSNVYSSISGQLAGGHAMLIIRYDDNKKAFRVRNSWDNDFGDKGYCWISYDIVEKYLIDAWILVM